MIQCSPEWWDIRAGKITGSAFHRMMVNKDTWLDNAKKIATNDFKNEDFVETDDTKRGNRLEAEARKVFERKHDVKVYEVGFITNSNLDHVGVSPDGVIYDDNSVIVGGLEIKCRNEKNFDKFAKDKKLKRSALMQCVCYMTVVDTMEYVDYVEYSETAPYSKNMVVVRITREDVAEHIKEAKKRLLILKQELNDGK